MKTPAQGAAERLTAYLQRRSKESRLDFNDIHSIDFVPLTASDIAILIDALAAK